MSSSSWPFVGDYPKKRKYHFNFVGSCKCPASNCCRLLGANALNNSSARSLHARGWGIWPLPWDHRWRPKRVDILRWARLLVCPWTARATLDFSLPAPWPRLQRRFAVETTTNVNAWCWSEVTHAVLGGRLDQDTAWSWRQVVFKLPWTAATWRDAEITLLNNDSSVHRVQVCEDTGCLTNDDEEIASAFGDSEWPSALQCEDLPSRNEAKALIVALRRSIQQCRGRRHSAAKDAWFNPRAHWLRLGLCLKSQRWWSFCQRAVSSWESGIATQDYPWTRRWAQKHDKTRRISWHNMVSPSHRCLKSVVNRRVMTTFRHVTFSRVLHTLISMSNVTLAQSVLHTSRHVTTRLVVRLIWYSSILYSALFTVSLIFLFILLFFLFIFHVGWFDVPCVLPRVRS